MVVRLTYFNLFLDLASLISCNCSRYELVITII